MTYLTFNNSNKKIIESKFNIKMDGFYIPLKEKLSELIQSIVEVVDGKGVIIDVTDLDQGRLAYFGAVYTALDSLDYNVQVVTLKNDIMMDITHHYALSSLIHTICDCDGLTNEGLIKTLRKFENLN